MWILGTLALCGVGFALGFLLQKVSQEETVRPPDMSEKLMSVLLTLQEYTIVKAETASLQEFCKLLLANASRLVQVDHGEVLMWNESASALQIAASTASKPIEGFLMESPEKMAERAFKSREPVLIPAGSGKTLASIPLMAQSAPLGVLQLQIKETLGPSDMHCLRLLAGQGAVVLNDLNLFERLQAFHMEMVETLYRTVNGLGANSDRHSEQTRQRASRLARAMKLPDEMVRYVEYAALLRGVGKIGVDQAILNKPGKLTPVEYEEIKKHTTIGHRLLSQVHLLAPAAKMVLYQQEWFNGRGYPEGLRGEDIPLGARIIAVIGAWEAMTTDRPYRKALTAEEAIAELTRAAGTQFDPVVVETFRKMEQGQR